MGCFCLHSLILFTVILGAIGFTKAEGHEGGHHGGHGTHGGHGEHHWHHAHGHDWWHHDRPPGWHHGDWEHWHHEDWQHWHHPWHDAYWYGGGFFGSYPGYYHDPNYYYYYTNYPSIEYEYDEAPEVNTTRSVLNRGIIEEEDDGEDNDYDEEDRGIQLKNIPKPTIKQGY